MRYLSDHMRKASIDVKELVKKLEEHIRKHPEEWNKVREELESIPIIPLHNPRASRKLLKIFLTKEWRE